VNKPFWSMPPAWQTLWRADSAVKKCLKVRGMPEVRDSNVQKRVVALAVRGATRYNF
jgi:hypothetical protein